MNEYLILFRQHDAHEFLMELLNALHDEAENKLKTLLCRRENKQVSVNKESSSQTDKTEKENCSPNINDRIDFKISPKLTSIPLPLQYTIPTLRQFHASLLMEFSCIHCHHNKEPRIVSSFFYLVLSSSNYMI
jgi:hypothetical protein